MPYVNKEPRQAIALRLKEAREKSGYLSPEDFCEKNKLRLGTYLKHEKAKSMIKMSHAARYAKLLSVPFHWLVLGESQSKPAWQNQNIAKETNLHSEA